MEEGGFLNTHISQQPALNYLVEILNSFYQTNFQQALIECVYININF